MSRKDYKRRIGSGFQKVDQRLLMAGDVDVWVSNNDLYIVGDGSSNRVDISTVNGMVRVTGNYLYGNTTINNGGTPFEFDADVIDDVRIDMHGGHDRVFINGLNLDNNSHGDLDIETHHGNDMVGVYNTLARDIKVRSGSDHDDVIVAFSTANRHIDVELGSGNDELDMYQAHALERIEIDGHNGNDDIAIQYSSAADKLFADLDDGDDIVWINGGTFEDVEINGDDDDDRVTLQGVTVNDDLDIELHDGYDQLFINNTNVLGSTNLDGGSDPDKISGSNNNFNVNRLGKNF